MPELSCVGRSVLVPVDLAVLVSVVLCCWRKCTPVFNYIRH
jgi:hypothetical protein